MKEKLRIGILGCASIAERMVAPAILSSGNFTLAAVASRTVERANAYAEKFGCEAITGYDHLLSKADIDAVYIPLPTGLHHEWAIKSLDAGKHILIEKSLATKLSEVEEIVKKATEKKLLVQENFMFAYHRQFEMIMEIVASGRLGTLRCIRSSFGFPPFSDKNNIRYNATLGGGALLDNGAYTLKIASLLKDAEPEVLAANLHIDNKTGVDIHGGIMMRFDDGCIVETAFGFDHFYQCNLELWGSKGKLAANRIFTAGPGISPRITIETNEKNEVLDVDPDNHFVNLLDHFSELIDKKDFSGSRAAILQQARLIQKVKDHASYTRD